MDAAEEYLHETSKEDLLLIRELTSTVSYYKRMLEALELDTLTGLPGSNKYLSFKEGIEKRAPTVGVIVFDVNDLKYYNDVKGHQSGDRLLQKAAESFRAVTGPDVQVFRTGGDEFVGIAAGCAEGDMDGIVAKWREKLAELNAADDGITCSVAHGVAFGAPGYRFSDVAAQADERMYAEKRRMKEAGLKRGDMR